MAEIVQTKELIETVIASLVAWVGVTAVFSIAIWAAARFVDLNRGGRPVAAGLRGGARSAGPGDDRGGSRRRHRRDDEEVDAFRRGRVGEWTNPAQRAIVILLALRSPSRSPAETRRTRS